MIISGTRIGGSRFIDGSTSVVSDEYFNLVALLLPGNGTNGQQNNTFLDASTNNFTVTRNGNTTQGTFSPFSQTGWSNYFDGVSDSLTFATSTALSLSGAFTIEFWIFLESLALDTINPSIITFPTQPNAWQVYINSAGSYIGLYDGNADVVNTTSSSITANRWYHVAISRDASNNLAIFLDGVRKGSTASGAGTIGSTTGTIRFMAYDGSQGDVKGYLSNLRIVKGSAVYNPTQTTLTVPTTALTAVSNTQLLICQSNRFVDNSVNAFAITVNGNTAVQPFSPFNPTAAYAAATVGGSAYFDGSGDYLSLASNSQTAVASNAFTLECYVYFSSPAANSNQPLYTNYTTFTTAGSIYIGKHVNYSGRMTVWISNYSTAGPLLLESTLPPAGWTHYALVRSGNTFTLYRNGAVSVSATFAGATTGATNASYIAAGIESGGVQMEGYLSSFRIVNGTAVYTSAFTPPTAPVTAIENTSLLLNYTNAGITDATAKNVLETVGGAAISTAQSKFGGSSMAFDGTTDYVVQPSSLNYGYGTGDFTIEFWLYLNSTGLQTIVSNLSAATGGVQPHIYINTTIRYYTNSADRITGAALSAGQWYHIAVSRGSGSTRLFVNGTQSGSTYADTNNYTIAPLGVGTYWEAGAPFTTSTLNGYIDDLRITRGYARYTANFTAPSTAFPTQ